MEEITKNERSKGNKLGKGNHQEENNEEENIRKNRKREQAKEVGKENMKMEE